MSGERPIGQRSKREDAAPSADTGNGVFWRATYTYVANGFRYTDEACIRDLSRKGCGIHGRAHVTVGSKTTVRFDLQDGRRPLSVAAKVAWVTGECFGVEFLRLSSDDYERMLEYMRNVLNDARANGVQTPRISREHRKPHLRLASVLLLAIGSLSGCGTLSVAPAPTTPFLMPTSDERQGLAQRASELDALALECAGDNSCDQEVHFSRALVSLFENRDAARASFEKVISLNATSPVATSSALWLEVLNNEPQTVTTAYRALLANLATHRLRQWMSRAVGVPTLHERTHGSGKPPLIQTLRHDVRERERRIAQLEAQLHALKVISEDQEDRRRVKPPDSFVPKVEMGR